MNKRCTLFAIAVLFLTLQTATCRAQTFEEVLGYGLPVVVITTVDGEEPTSERISHPDGFYTGTSITNIVPKNGRVQVWRGDTLWYDSGDYVDGKSGMKIRHRGNVSAAFSENKPYKLKLQKKADLIETRWDSDARDMRSKNWVLLNYSYSVETPVAFRLSSLVGLEYTPRVEFVNVMFNCDYRGMYILGENISREDNCRIIVDKQDGYIIELDPYFWNETFFIRSRLCGFLAWTLKYPDAEDLTPEQEANIRSDIERMEASLTGTDYPQVIDVRSFVRWIMVHDIMGTRDGAGCNVFIARTDRAANSLMRMPAVWDMADHAMLVPDEWSVTRTYPGIRLFPSLFENVKCMEFTRIYIEEWKRIKEEHVIDSLIAWIDRFATTPEAVGIRGSALPTMQRWGLSKGLNNLDSQFETAKNWMINREKWIDEQVTAMENFYSGMPSVPMVKEVENARKTILSGHLYIIRDNATYTIDGKQIRGNVLSQ